MGLFGWKREPGRKKGNRLNMLIAKTHRLSSRIIGMQLTGGSFIGIALSALQMALGFVFVSSAVIKGSWLIGVGIGFIGAILAVLIERLSLGGLSSVRVSWLERSQLDKAYYGLKKPKEHQTKLYNKQVWKCRINIGLGAFFGLLGIFLSATLGDVFWSSIFSGMGDPTKQTFYALSCASVISLTFVHGELFKQSLDGVIQEIITDFHIMETGVIAEEHNMQIDMMVNAYDVVRNDASVRAPAESKIKKIIARRLTGFARQVSNAGTRVDMIVDSSLVGGSPVQALPSPRKKYQAFRDELLRLLAANANLTQREVSTHFGVSSSTASEWLRKAKAGE